MKTVDTALGFDRNEVAQFRLRCIQILEKSGYDGVKLAFPQVSRPTVYRWRHDFSHAEKRLTSLLPHSTRPKKIRQMVAPTELLGLLKALRQQHPHLSKYKLKPFLDAWCQEHHQEMHSVSWIGKVIATHKLFFGTRRKVHKYRRHSRSGYTIHKTPHPDKIALGYLQLDGVKVYWAGEQVLFLTALELKTRTAWVKIVPTISSHHAKLFLEQIKSEIPFSLHTVHTDNGSEFHAVFDQALVELKLTHLWSPPRTPKIHAHMERFNKTLQEEFVDYHIDEAIAEPELFQHQLTDWLTWYNTKRPHLSLHLMTPQQYLVQLQTPAVAQSLKCP
jgi:transposase InsO family protein